jgi:hypothetical protein
MLALFLVWDVEIRNAGEGDSQILRVVVTETPCQKEPSSCSLKGTPYGRLMSWSTVHVPRCCVSI